MGFQDSVLMLTGTAFAVALAALAVALFIEWRRRKNQEK